MTDAFDFAWALLKADPSQQLLAPQQVVRGGESAARFMPQRAMHPAIGGMMERQGIQQPMQGQYATRLYTADMPNPVERMGQQSTFKPETLERARRAPTIEGPTFHGENRNFYGFRGENRANALAQMIDPSLAQGSVSYPTTGSALPVGVTPYENVMQAM